MLNQIFKVPVEISETEYIQVIGEDNSQPNPHVITKQCRWICCEFNPVTKRTQNLSFRCTDDELDSFSPVEEKTIYATSNTNKTSG